jgi:hypothetical protein
MTIAYSHGTTVNATLLSQDENEIRAIAAGSDDAQIFRCIQGTWISEEIEPVTIKFDLQAVAPSPVPAVEECICPKERAAHLIRLLLAGDDSDHDMVSNAVPTFNPQGEQFAGHSFGRSCR